jgi:hypothetical protein
MYIKFHGNKSGGSKGSVNYLLNERVAAGTAKVLKGSPEFTKAIIGEMKTKHKVTMGSINLKEGETLTTSQKEQIMSDFEKTLMPGLDENQYNILWVEHTDKGRLELNFVIPKIELTTQKALNPYFHKLDFARIDMFEDIQNIKYNLASKKDPANAQTLQGEKKNINLVKDYKELDNTLHELVQSGDIQNREHMIELLKVNNIKVTRSNKEGISLKLPDSKKAHRFKGSIYNEQFTSITELEAISEATDRRIKEFQSRDTSRELEQTIKRLDEYNEQKAQLNREKYKLKDDCYTKAEQEQIQSKNLDNSNSINNDRNNPSRDALSRIHPKISRENKVASSRGNEISKQEREIYNEPKIYKRIRQQNSIHKDKGVDYDNRTDVTRRIRERAEAESRAYRTKRKAYEEVRKARIELYKTITRRSRELQAEYSKNSTELRTKYEEDSRRQQEVKRGFIGTAINTFKRFGECAKSFIKEKWQSMQKSNNLKEFTEQLQNKNMFKVKKDIEHLDKADPLYEDKYTIAKEIFKEKMKEHNEKINAMPRITREDLRRDTLLIKQKTNSHERLR